MNSFIFIIARGVRLPEESFVVRRSFVSGDVEWLVKEFVVGNIVVDDHLVRFRSLAPSAMDAISWPTIE